MSAAEGTAVGAGVPRGARRGPVAAWWADRRLATKGLVVTALPLLIFVAAILVLRRAGAAEASARDDVRVTLAIQSDVHAVHVLLAEAANGVRGYLLTGQPRFLEPYAAAEPALAAAFGRLRGLMRDPEAARGLARVATLAAAEQRALAALVERRQQAGPADPAGTAGTAGTPAALEANTRVLDALRDQIARVQARERVLLAERQARAEAVHRRALVLTAGGLGAGVAGSLLAVVLFSSGIVRRVERLREGAARLGRGQPPPAFPPARDEIGDLAQGMAEAGALLRGREQALRESEERLRLLVEGAHDYGIFALDADGRVASWNAGAERIKGWRADEILGQPFACFYPPEERDARPARNLAAARAHGRVEDEGWRVRKDGTRFFANVVLTALHDEAGRLRGFAKITRDVTERRRAEAAVEAARREAEAASAAKSAFLSRMSHELRTPLNAVLGFAQLLELDADQRPADEREAVAQILRAGRHLLGLIDEVVDVARVERGELALALEPTPVAAVVAEAVALTRPQAREAGVTVHVAATPGGAGAPAAGAPAAGAPVARADAGRLLQVLLNLLSNAIKYNAHPGGRVDVRTRVDGAWVEVEVADTGFGVEPALAARLFTPFARLGRAAQAREGTGLGLAVSRTLVRAMGGELSHAPRADGGPGAVFRATLPRADAAPARPNAAPAKPDGAASPNAAASPNESSAPNEAAAAAGVA